MAERLSITLRLPSGATRDLALPGSAPVRQVLVGLRDRLALPSGSYRLVHGGRPLAETETLRGAGVQSGDTLELMSGMTGGTNI
ncbi:MAG: ubiquitin-like domain-containing protein [Bacteroidota bacterium]